MYSYDFKDFLQFFEKTWQEAITEEQQEAIYNETITFEFGPYDAKVPFSMVSYWAVVDLLESIEESTTADTWFAIRFKNYTAFVPRTFESLELLTEGLIKILGDM